MKTKNIINCIALLVVAVVIIAADSLTLVTGIVSAVVLCGVAVLLNNVKRTIKIKRFKGLFLAVIVKLSFNGLSGLK